MNRYPFWKYLLILVIVVVGFFYALPNIYAPDPAVQISGSSVSLEITERDMKKAEQVLKDLGIEYFGAEFDKALDTKYHNYYIYIYMFKYCQGLMLNTCIITECSVY